jgi:hypothetical protein
MKEQTRAHVGNRVDLVIKAASRWTLPFVQSKPSWIVALAATTVTLPDGDAATNARVHYRMIANFDADSQNRLPDHVREAIFESPDSVILKFCDGTDWKVSVADLGIDSRYYDPESIAPAPGNTGVLVQDIDGNTVILDGSGLRIAVDPEYAAKVERLYFEKFGSISALLS